MRTLYQGLVFRAERHDDEDHTIVDRGGRLKARLAGGGGVAVEGDGR